MNGGLRALVFVLFWGGIIGIVREWRYSRQHRLVITLAEKLYLLFVLPLFLGASFIVDLIGVPLEINGPATLLAICVALNAWPTIRRVRRA